MEHTASTGKRCPKFQISIPSLFSGEQASILSPVAGQSTRVTCKKYQLPGPTLTNSVRASGPVVVTVHRPPASPLCMWAENHHPLLLHPGRLFASSGPALTDRRGEHMRNMVH